MFFLTKVLMNYLEVTNYKKLATCKQQNIAFKQYLSIVLIFKETSLKKVFYTKKIVICSLMCLRMNGMQHLLTRMKKQFYFFFSFIHTVSMFYTKKNTANSCQSFVQIRANKKEYFPFFRFIPTQYQSKKKFNSTSLTIFYQ